MEGGEPGGKANQVDAISGPPNAPLAYIGSPSSHPHNSQNGWPLIQSQNLISAEMPCAAPVEFVISAS